MAILGISETNALMAYRYEVGPCYKWLAKLSNALLNIGHVRLARQEDAGTSNGAIDDLPVCCNLT